MLEVPFKPVALISREVSFFPFFMDDLRRAINACATQTLMLRVCIFFACCCVKKECSAEHSFLQFQLNITSSK